MYVHLLTTLTAAPLALARLCTGEQQNEHRGWQDPSVRLSVLQTDMESGRQVALKSVNRGASGEGANLGAIKEVQALQELEHDNVLKVSTCTCQRCSCVALWLLHWPLAPRC